MLTHWDPFAELSRLQDRLFFGTSRELSFRPAVDIYEDAEAITLTAEVPGMKPEEVQVHVDNGVLTLSGERKLEREDRKDGYHRIERAYGTFSRSFVLPETVDADNIQAEAKDGLLRLRLPKRSKPSARKIEVKTS
ncbi:MAG: Hsp20/alpha crystallin family protein [Myxococcota bacterium]|nr:Hsp20/alpha crystallin family protein [Myxococcota bacterium]MDW8361829.1 Hsp20/alpha crystallin family protein [Myxococcales bacterium]